MNTLYRKLMNKVDERTGSALNSSFETTEDQSEKIYIIPPNRTRYLSEISENNRGYDQKANNRKKLLKNCTESLKPLKRLQELTWD
jgi:isobutyryl-CoA mutase